MKVNPAVLQWALDWNGLSEDDLRSAFPKLEEWLKGDTQPTIKQLERFARRTHTLLPYFFADSLPDVRLQIADFRTPDGETPTNPSPELFETIDEMLFRQGWMGDTFADLGYDPVPLIGRFDKRGVTPRGGC